MRIDLHTHSSVSDGTERPADVVRRAHEAGLDVVALTDHDTFDGWPEALAAGRQYGVDVVPGVEISTQLGGRGAHVLAYHVDTAHRPLARELARVREDRRERLQRIAVRLTKAGIAVDLAEILHAANGASSVGRPHVADVMVAKGYVKTRDEAFASWLSVGGVGFVEKYAPGIVDAIGLVHAAGGVAVLAHPWGRGSRHVFSAEAIGALADAGLDGIEADHQDHDDAARAELRAVAAAHGLAVTGSSDYHGTGKVGHELGVNTTAEAEWERLLARVGRRPSQTGHEG
ncbi:PHP domain-containing protein [Phytoactinopolyspora alkaliphila]|uniref:PHP domain-containing protein n=1 Tax=Phytoactinopolyspora alkaliphila TaxID=1783498 RepID=A0A6N9YQ52_9ACTN|nr:PHP domain-containing protein [Phytoactinopolyspora alkaliphila]NED97181.1 PHP domain-containing protein [Phytoactinopolyspora alkaliphila]